MLLSVRSWFWPNQYLRFGYEELTLPMVCGYQPQHLSYSDEYVLHVTSYTIIYKNRNCPVH